MKRLTPWTQMQKDEFTTHHEAIIAQYFGTDVVIDGKVYNVQQELREARIKWLAGIPTL